MKNVLILVGMSFDAARFLGQKLRKAGNSQFSGVVTKIAIVSVSFSVFVLVLSFAILEGFKTNIKNNIISFASHIQVSKFDVLDNLENVPVDVSVKNSFLGLNGIDKIQVYGIGTGIIKAGEEVHGVVFKGVSNDFIINRFAQNIKEGRFPQVGRGAYKTEVVISKNLASKLGLKIGDKPIMFFITDRPKPRKLEIVGIYETGMGEFDDVFILGDIQLVRNVNKWSDSLVTGFEIFVKDFDRISETGNQVYDAMPNDMQLEVITEKYMQIFDWFKVLDYNVVIFITIIIFVAGFNMVSTVVVMIMERTSMVGVLKALGANNSFIGKVFFFYGMDILFKGLLWGNVLALTTCFVQYKFKVIPLDPENYFMSSVPIEWTWVQIVGVNVLITLLIASALSLPLLFINRIKPANAIKFK